MYSQQSGVVALTLRSASVAADRIIWRLKGLCISAGLPELCFPELLLDGTLRVCGNRSFFCCIWFRIHVLQELGSVGEIGVGVIAFHCLREFAVQGASFPLNTSLRTSVDLY